MVTSMKLVSLAPCFLSRSTARSRPTCTSRWLPRSGGRSPKGRRSRASACPARDLAAVLEVNPNTVLRALRQLRDEGLLEFRRGRGITVAATPEHGAVVAQARKLTNLARKHGYRRDELIRIIEALD